MCAHMAEGTKQLTLFDNELIAESGRRGEMIGGDAWDSELRSKSGPAEKQNRRYDV
jgi:hypothetical protein